MYVYILYIYINIPWHWLGTSLCYTYLHVFLWAKSGSLLQRPSWPGHRLAAGRVGLAGAASDGATSCVFCGDLWMEKINYDLGVIYHYQSMYMSRSIYIYICTLVYTYRSGY